MRASPELHEFEESEFIRQKLARREFVNAEMHLRHIISRHGLRPAYATLLARTLKGIGKYGYALHVLNECLARNPGSMRLYGEKGDIYFARMNYAHAAENYARALSFDAEDSGNSINREFIRDNLAVSRCFLGDIDKAIRELHSLVVMYPEELRFRRHYAAALAKNAAEDNDVAAFTDIKPEYALEVKRHLCKNLLDEKRFHGALRCSGQLYMEYPRNPSAARCHAAVLFRLMRFDEAVCVLEEAVRNQYADVLLYGALIKYYKAMDRERLAHETCLNGLSCHRNSPMLLFHLLSLDNAAGRERESQKCLERIMAIPGAYLKWQQRKFSNIVPIGLAKKFYGKFAFPETEEGRCIAECFRVFKTLSGLYFFELHDPGKVVLPESDSHDLQETLDFATEFRNNAAVFVDGNSLRCNIKDGSRVVVNQPAEYAYTVFLTGLCHTTRGWSDSTTLASALQDVFNSRSAEKVRVVSYGKDGRGGFAENTYLRLTNSDDLRPGDKVLHYDLFPDIPGIRCSSDDQWDIAFDGRVSEYNMLRNFLSLKGVGFHLGFVPTLARDEFKTLKDDMLYEALRKLGKIPPPGELECLVAAFSNRLTDNEFAFSFFDHVLQHKAPDEYGRFWYDDVYYSLSLNYPLAEAMYDFLSLPAKMKQTEYLPDFKKQSLDWLQRLAFKAFLKNEGIREWIAKAYDAEISNHGNVGAIVMNCNPFTLGHRYLVEKALESVEALYLFVVEEDLSQFSFADRLMLVKEGVKDFHGRVKVLPSGKFIISSFSFAGYFTKEMEITPPDSTTDVLIFASMIAPALNIRTRFVGEEPTCLVTRSYNERMEQLLPDMGVAVRVIPRKEVGGTAISASRVRKALEENDLQSIRNLVPDTTYNYLTQRV